MIKKTKKFLLLDFGNNAIKCCFLSGLKKNHLRVEDFQTLIKKIESETKTEKLYRILISSVWTNEENALIKNSLLSFSNEVLFIDSYFDKLVFSKYKNSSLGMDRKSAILYCFFKKIYPAVIIDAGTAITVDFFNKDVFEGGIIMGGINLELSALHEKTKRLPLLKPDIKKVTFPPTTTNDAILKGVIAIKGYGIQALIENEVKKNKIFKNDKFDIVLTGGDAKFLKRYINPSQVLDNIVIRALFELSLL